MIKLNNKLVSFANFPNGETKLVEDSIRKALSNKNVVTFKYENDSDLIKLYITKKFIDSLEVKSELLVAYMPYSRMDRQENDSAFTLKYISEFMNALGFRKVNIIEPHSDVTPALIDKSKSLYINFDILPQVLEDIQFDHEKDYIMFPDAGAAKRYSKLKGMNTVIGHKNRDFLTGEIKGLELQGNFETGGKKAVIVDDLSSYGGTFVKSAEALKEQGIEQVYLLVAHAENSVFKGKLFDYIDHLYTTDSIITEQDHWENAKFKDKLTIYKIEEVVI